MLFGSFSLINAFWEFTWLLASLFYFFVLIPHSHELLLFEILKRGNFRCTGRTVGVETQLSNLAEITQVIDPKLHHHLGIFLNLCFLIMCFKSLCMLCNILIVNS